MNGWLVVLARSYVLFLLLQYYCTFFFYEACGLSAKMLLKACGCVPLVLLDVTSLRCRPEREQELLELASPVLGPPVVPVPSPVPAGGEDMLRLAKKSVWRNNSSRSSTAFPSPTTLLVSSSMDAASRVRPYWSRISWTSCALYGILGVRAECEGRGGRVVNTRRATDTWARNWEREACGSRENFLVVVVGGGEDNDDDDDVAVVAVEEEGELMLSIKL